MNIVSELPSLSVRRRIDLHSFFLNGAYPLAIGLLSLAITGFHYGVLNDVFHIPIVQRAYRWPQFAHDPFYQNLRYYSSALWPVLSAAGQQAATPQAFFALFVVIRLLTFVSLAFLLRKLALSGAEQIVTMVVVAVSENTIGLTRVGYEDMLVGYLDHTSLVWPLIFCSIGLVCDRKLGLATALTGVLFCANAFVAVWHGLALALVAAGLTLKISRTGEPYAPRDTLIKFTLGTVAAIVIAGPVLLWTLKGLKETPGFTPFSYKAFLWEYFPKHFLIQSSTPLRLLSLCLSFSAGLEALRRLGSKARIVFLFMLGYGLVFCLGVAAPFVLDDRLLLNLHLLRSDGCVIFLAVIATGALSARLISGGGARRSVIGVGLLIGSTFAKASPLMLLVWAAGGVSIKSRLRPHTGVGRGAVAAAVLVLAAAGVTAVRSASPPNPNLRSEQELGAWIERNTPVQTHILARSAADPASGLEELQLYSKRRVYTDWKRGATAMWRPDFYADWRTRMNEVARLPSAEAAFAFACGHHLDLVVERTASSQGHAGAALVHRNQIFSAFRPSCPAGGSNG